MKAIVHNKRLRMMLFVLLIVGLVLPVPFTNTAEATSGKIIYVKQNATGDGSSWDNALGDLHTALVQAQSGDQVWIAAGTYIPTGNQEGDDERTRHFQMKNGVRIYGGFPADASSETRLFDRNWEVYKTVLSGDRGTDRLYHVFYHKNLGLDATAVLDGVIITGGDATYGGGGMYNSESSPLLRNVIFTNNAASDHGGGIFIGSNSNAILHNVTITRNSSRFGGGIYVDQSSPVLINVSITDNESKDSGGGLFFFAYAEGKLTIINSIISGNKATNYGGGIGLYGDTRIINTSIYGNVSKMGGGIHHEFFGSLSLTNVTLSGNQAETGGGLSYSLSSGSKTIINNSVIWGNRASIDYDNIKNYSSKTSDTTVTHSLIEGSGGSGSKWNQKLGLDGGNNIDDNPQFVDYQPAMDFMPMSEGDYRLKTGSPAIDAGLNELYYAETNYQKGLDVAGGIRIDKRNIDLGAYEYSVSNEVKPPQVDVTPPLSTAPVGATFTAMVYDPTQKYVGTFDNVNSNGITGSLSGIRVDEDGVADANGKFTKLQGVLDGTANGKLVEVQLSVNGPSLYVRLISAPATDGQFEVKRN